MKVQLQNPLIPKIGFMWWWIEYDGQVLQDIIKMLSRAPLLRL